MDPVLDALKMLYCASGRSRTRLQQEEKEKSQGDLAANRLDLLLLLRDLLRHMTTWTSLPAHTAALLERYLDILVGARRAIDTDQPVDVAALELGAQALMLQPQEADESKSDGGAAERRQPIQLSEAIRQKLDLIQQDLERKPREDVERAVDQISIELDEESPDVEAKKLKEHARVGDAHYQSAQTEAHLDTLSFMKKALLVGKTKVHLVVHTADAAELITAENKQQLASTLERDCCGDCWGHFIMLTFCFPCCGPCYYCSYFDCERRKWELCTNLEHLQDGCNYQASLAFRGAPVIEVTARIGTQVATLTPGTVEHPFVCGALEEHEVWLRAKDIDRKFLGRIELRKLLEFV